MTCPPEALSLMPDGHQGDPGSAVRAGSCPLLPPALTTHMADAKKQLRNCLFSFIGEGYSFLFTFERV